jgi:hypothetical protein
MLTQPLWLEFLSTDPIKNLLQIFWFTKAMTVSTVYDNGESKEDAEFAALMPMEGAIIDAVFVGRTITDQSILTFHYGDQ